MNISRMSLVTKMRAVVLLLSLALVSLALPQGQPDIVWQAQAGPAIAFSSDGQILVAGNQLRLAADGTLIHTLTLPRVGQGINAVDISKDGQYIAIGIQSFNQNLHLYNAPTGTLIQGRISAHSNGTTSVAFSPDSQTLASGGRDGTAKLWHLPDMTLIQTLNGGVGYRARIFAVAYSNDGQLLALGGQAGVLIFRVADGTLVRALSPAVSTRCLAFSPDGQMLAAGSDAIDQQGQCSDCTIKMWRISDGALLQTIDGGNNGIIAIAFSPDQQVIAAGSGDRIYDGVVRFWRVADGTLFRFFNQTGSYVTDVAYSPDGSLFSFARVDELVVVIHSPSPSCSGTLSPTSHVFSASGGDGSVSVNAPAGCNWTATSDVSWITLTSASSASGSALVTFEVRGNTTGSARTGTVTIAGQTFTAMQDSGAGDNCDYTISPTAQSFPAAGGSGTVNIAAAEGCAWQAVSNAGWITITSGSGMGNGAMTYSVAANSSQTSRRATITIDGRIFSIKQK
jgi:WD40 repeat protein